MINGLRISASDLTITSDAFSQCQVGQLLVQAPDSSTELCVRPWVESRLRGAWPPTRTRRARQTPPPESSGYGGSTDSWLHDPECAGSTPGPHPRTRIDKCPSCRPCPKTQPKYARCAQSGSGRLHNRQLNTLRTLEQQGSSVTTRAVTSNTQGKCLESMPTKDTSPSVIGSGSLACSCLNRKYICRAPRNRSRKWPHQ